LAWTCAVSVDGAGCLIMGASGAGKSTLSFEMIALGAELIADDRVDLSADNERILLSCPDAIRGRIEARGIGLIETTSKPSASPCALIVDLDHSDERLPAPRQRDLLGISCPVIFGLRRPGLAAILTLLLRQGRLLDPGKGIDP
ncbi:MAG: HPr kinase/phosphatase C-terminal domain-containing protein, partial [Pseudomonadota bacterium]